MDIMSLDFIIGAIGGAPIWVWGILGYLLYVGIKATRTRIIYIPKILIIPAVLISLNYKTLISVGNLIPDTSGMLIGFLIGFVVGHNTSIKILKNLNSIELPGNYYTVVTLILLFVMKYVFGYLRAVQPSIALQFIYIEIYISALFSGFFSGRSFCYLYRFYNDK